MKAKPILEIYDPNVWQAFDEYAGLTVDRRLCITPRGVGKPTYYLNDQNRHGEMLSTFVSIKDEHDLIPWIQEYGLPDSRDNWTVTALLAQVSLMRWYVDLLNAALHESHESDAYLSSQLTVDPPELNGWAFSQFQRKQLTLLDSKISQHERLPQQHPPLAIDEERIHQLLMLQLQQFKDLNVVVCFCHGSLPKIGLAVTKRTWKRTPEQVRLIARVAVARQAGYEMASSFVGAHATADLLFDTRSGVPGLVGSFNVVNPWQAMSHALFKRALNNRGLSFCQYCGKAFTSRRKTALYCLPPAKCKDNYNNQRR